MDFALFGAGLIAAAVALIGTRQINIRRAHRDLTYRAGLLLGEATWGLTLEQATIILGAVAEDTKKALHEAGEFTDGLFYAPRRKHKPPERKRTTPTDSRTEALEVEGFLSEETLAELLFTERRSRR